MKKMTEEKKTAGNELNDEKLDKVAGGMAVRSATFFCERCRKTKSTEYQSSDPRYCTDCYHYVLEIEQNAVDAGSFMKPSH